MSGAETDYSSQNPSSEDKGNAAISYNTIKLSSGGMIDCYTISATDITCTSLSASDKVKAPSFQGSNGSRTVILQGNDEGAASVKFGGGYFYPDADDTVNLGSDGGYWANVYCRNGTIKTSDRNLKTDIATYGSNIEDAYMEFEPVSYRFKIFSGEDNNDRTHYGLIAQQVEEVLQKYGISNEDAAFLCKDTLRKPNKAGELVQYGIRYEELVAVNMHMIQKALRQIQKLEAEINFLKTA